MNVAVRPRVRGRRRAGAVSYPAAGCQHWLTLWPHAHSCAQAAVLENSSDAVSLRLAVGVLGLVRAGRYYLAARRSRTCCRTASRPRWR